MYTRNVVDFGNLYGNFQYRMPDSFYVKFFKFYKRKKYRKSKNIKNFQKGLEKLT